MAVNILAFGLGLVCAYSVVRAVPALVAGDRGAFRLWLLRGVGAGAGCLGLSAITRSFVGN